jgi:hypothetical protein
MASKSIIRAADNLVRLKGPTIRSTGAILDNTGASATMFMRLFDEKKEQCVLAATTRLRTAVAASGTTWEIPHIDPIWVEDGDTLEILNDDGTFTRHSIVGGGVSAGTDTSTPSTNFDTLTMATGPPVACKVGAQIRLVIKASGGKRFPIVPKNVRLEPSDTAEFETDVLGTLDVIAIDKSYKDTVATEDGVTAKNQDDRISLVTMTVTTTAAITAGRRIRKKIGADIAMTEYGAAATWTDENGGGFAGTITDTLAGLETGDLIRVEGHFNGGAGLAALYHFLAPVSESEVTV